jgi:hypothetical protein
MGEWYENRIWECRLDSSDSRYKQVHGHESSGSIKGRKLVDQLNNYVFISEERRWSMDLFTWIIQSDPLGGGPKSVTIKHAITYQWKWNLASIWLCRCGDRGVTEDAEICFPSAWRQRPTRRYMFANAAGQEGSQTEENCAKRASSHRVNISKYTLLPRFVLPVKYCKNFNKIFGAFSEWIILYLTISGVDINPAIHTFKSLVGRNCPRVQL